MTGADIISLEEHLAAIASAKKAGAFVEERDALLGAIRKLASLSDGWDGEDGRAPTTGIVNDAVAVAQAWPSQLPMPTMETTSTGTSFGSDRRSGFVVAG